MQRRRFIRIGAFGTAGMLLALARPRQAGAAPATEALLLSCMDYRLVDDIERYMSGRNLADKYDHVILAGASLGAIAEKFPAWRTTFWEHLDIAIALHHIPKVIVMDHRDCGAYKVMLGTDHLKDRATETAAHAAQLRALRLQIQQRHPKLAVELLLMALDGTVETVD